MMIEPPKETINEASNLDKPVGVHKLGVLFMWSHPAHLVAMGLGSGLSPIAPGTAGTLWAWIFYVLIQPWMNDFHIALVVFLIWPLGWWVSSVTAKNMRVLDPGSVVIDEIAAFWLILWLLMPANFIEQIAAFILFRFFDAVKPGPVGWADRLFKETGSTGNRRIWYKAGFGIMLDDLVAAGCTLLIMAFWRLAS